MLIDLRPVPQKLDTIISKIDGSIAEMSFFHQSLLFCELSCLAYFDYASVQTWAHVMNFDSVVKIENDGGLAYLFETETDIILSFRGTDNTTNIKTNFDLDLVKDGMNPGKVHHGFVKLADRLLNNFLALVDYNNTNKKIWVTGHSLGGAIAAIMAVRAERRTGPNIDGVFTFGQPRIGNKTYIKKIYTPYYRWVNSEDLITKVPMWLPHFGNIKYFRKNGDIGIPGMFASFLIYPSLESIEDHDIIQYRDKIIKNEGRDLNPSPIISKIFGKS